MKGKFTAALAATILITTSLAHQSEARTRHHKDINRSTIITCDIRGCTDRKIDYNPRVQYASVVRDDGRTIGGRPSGCPHAFCGCGTSLHIFGRIIPDLNLAANWGKRFSPSPCAAGNVAWRYGHVFAIESCNGDGTVLAYDPNSGGHQTRIHTVSLSGYRIVDPHRERLASR